MPTIRVKAAQSGNRVAFYERAREHPGGQVFVRGDGRVVEAAETRALTIAIREGRLVQAQETPPNQQKQDAEPWEGYGEATVDAIVERLPQLSDAERARVISYERAGKNRKGVIEPYVNWNS